MIAPRNLLFGGALLLVLLAHILVVLPGLSGAILPDEAYNMTVSLNLSRGLGYASDGVLTTRTLDPFDVRVTTGPTVLLPVAGALAAGLDILTASRLVMLGFYAALLAAVGVLGARIAGRAGAIAAVASVLALDAAVLQSPIPSPTSLLGEVAAAALAAASLATLRSRPLVSGLLIGLALQAKVVAALFVPVFLVALILAGRGSSRRETAGRAARFAAGALIPTVAFELWKLASLGPDGYAASTRGFLEFLFRKTGDFSPLDKVGALFTGWFGPAPLAIVMAAIAVGAVVYCVLNHETRRSFLRDNHRGFYLAVAASALLVWCLWWVGSRGNPVWIRTVAPALLVTVPVLLATAVAALRAVAGSVVLRERIAARAAAGVLTVLLAVQVVAHVSLAWHPRMKDTLEQQLVVAHAVEALEVTHLQGKWRGTTPIAVLADAHQMGRAVPNDGSVPYLIRLRDGRAVDPTERTECGRVILETDQYLLCWPPSSPRA